MKLLYPLINELYGIDLEKYFIDICRKRYGLNTFYHDDIENSDLELNKKFDLIISSDVIEHLLDPDKLIKYIKKYCTSKSFIIFSTPDRDILRGKNCHTSPSIGHIREWNSKEFKKYLIFSGFEIISHKIVLNVKLSFIIKTYIFDRKKKLKDNVNNFRLLLKILFLLNSKERKGVQSTQLTLCKIKP